MRHEFPFSPLAWLLAVAASFPAMACGASSPAPPPPAADRYEVRQPHDPDGIGKFYYGREIAHVMGHEGADWLERPEREAEENPSALVDALKLRPGDVVADIGAGSGYLTWRLARAVGSAGRVYAVDIQQEMLDLLVRKMAALRQTNVIPVLGTVTNTGLPSAAIDLAIMVDVYHEFSHPFEMMESICQAMKPGARIVFVEYRADDPNVPIKRLHTMTVDQVRKEMAPHPLAWQAALEVLPWQHIIVFTVNERSSRPFEQLDP